jgi:hypothetical protein
VRTLRPAPRSFLDPGTGLPAFGSYAGPLPPVELGTSELARGAFARLTRRKKWLYLAIASEDLWISMAIVRMGYASSAFAYVFDHRAGRMAADRTALGPPQAATVADDAHADGVLARFSFGGTTAVVNRRSDTCEVRASFGSSERVEVDAVLDASVAPPAVAAIATLTPGRASATEKRALAAVRGTAVVSGRRVSLDGALGAYDYTHGLMPRRTRWRWAFAMGRAKGGEPVAVNLVQGFVGEGECAAFVAEGVRPLGEARISYDEGHPERDWKIDAEGVGLTFRPGAVHVQRTNLGFVRSRFLQPVGRFHGRIEAGGRDVVLEGVPGVVEDQDVLW